MAWGPEGRQAISMAALQLARRKAPDAFLAGETSYEADMLRGAVDGVDVIRDQVPLNNDFQAVDAIYSQIQILRDARRRGAGSHFAYRMGVLSALVSEVMLPYGLIFDEDDRPMRNQVVADLEERVSSYYFSANKYDYHYVRSTKLYFDEKRVFQREDRILLAGDYESGRGQRGFLSEAGPVYFQRAVDAVADVWYTVLRIEGDAMDVIPSNRQMAKYYIDEVGYLLSVKKNMEYAGRAYRMFSEVNPGFGTAYVEIGDLYYGFGEGEGMARGVEEWKIAQRIPGDPRRMASQRLSKHYIGEGETFFRKSAGPESEESDLTDALRAFQFALEYDRTNQVAAKRISETSVAISERREQFDLQQKFIENAMGIIKHAERSRMEKDFGGALTSYNQALMLVESVSADFKDLHMAARDTSSDVKKELKSVVTEVIGAANESIEKGDNAMLSSNYDDAIKFYSAVRTIVSVIPGERGSINAQRRNELVETAETQIDEAELQRKRQEERKRTKDAPPNPFAGND